mmetsp:Transcript_21315/g.52819  ORF Transcript_21315/g.52819 Transcript_21315/m.52819 type:complete len:330 (-) Transcript_21315:343-1332(-)
MLSLAHELKDSVEVGRIGSFEAHNGLQNGGNILCTAGIDNVFAVFDITGLGGLGLFAGTDPIDVSEQRVDFSIVSYRAHGLGKWPLRSRIGRKPTVVNDKLGRVVWVFQIEIKLFEHFGLNHTLVDNRSGTEGRKVDNTILVVPFESLLFEFDGKSSSYVIQSALKGVTGLLILVIKVFRGLYKELPDAGHAGKCQRTQDIGVSGSLSPAQPFQVVVFADLFHDRLDGVAASLVPGQKNLGNTGSGAGFGAVLLKNLPWNVRHDSGTVSGNRVASTSSSVLHAGEGTETIPNNFVGSVFLCGICNETDTTGITFLGERHGSVVNVALYR